VGVGVGVGVGAGLGVDVGLGVGVGVDVGVGVCMLKIFQIGISCLGNSHKHQNNIMQKKTSIKINNYLPCSIKITCMAR
jgi:hypothetical protein